MANATHMLTGRLQQQTASPLKKQQFEGCIRSQPAAVLSCGGCCLRSHQKKFSSVLSSLRCSSFDLLCTNTPPDGHMHSSHVTAVCRRKLKDVSLLFFIFHTSTTTRKREDIDVALPPPTGDQVRPACTIFQKNNICRWKLVITVQPWASCRGRSAPSRPG